MLFGNREDFIKQLKGYYVDIISLDSAEDGTLDGSLCNLGFDSVTYYSKDTINNLLRHNGGVPTHPLTRRHLVDSEIDFAQTLDWHGTALLYLFRNMRFFEMCSASMFTSAQMLEYIMMPQYYKRMADSGSSEIPGIHGLFLEPLIPGMPDQQRLLVCPFLASDGGTYNLKTLHYLFMNDLPSPLTRMPFENFSVSFNRVLSRILTDCWNAPMDCAALFCTNKLPFNQQRVQDSENYNQLTKIQRLLTLEAHPRIKLPILRIGNAIRVCTNAFATRASDLSSHTYFCVGYPYIHEPTRGYLEKMCFGKRTMPLCLFLEGVFQLLAVFTVIIVPGAPHMTYLYCCLGGTCGIFYLPTLCRKAPRAEYLDGAGRTRGLTDCWPQRLAPPAAPPAAPIIITPPRPQEISLNQGAIQAAIQYLILDEMHRELTEGPAVETVV